MQSEEKPECLSLVFEYNNGRLKLSSEVLAILRKYVQDSPEKMEAGGVLIGRLLKDNGDVVIDAVTEPMIGDKRTRFSFFRAKKRHQRVIDSFWKESEGTISYLGEWHTHPEPFPTPSVVDRSDWMRRLKADTFSNKLFYIIVGINEIKCWYGDKGGSVLYSTKLRT